MKCKLPYQICDTALTPAGRFCHFALPSAQHRVQAELEKHPGFRDLLEGPSDNTTSVNFG